MGKLVNQLSDRVVKNAKEPGQYADGAGLYMLVSKSGTKSWGFRYRFKTKAHDIGLGSYPIVTLAEARQKVAECRKLLHNDIDPLEARNAARVEAQRAVPVVEQVPEAVTFAYCARECFKVLEPEFKNAKHAAQWIATLKTYAFPVFGTVPVDAVTTEMVKRVLDPIWATKTETATRVRERIEKVLDWAKVSGYRDGENPARWRGHLSFTMSKPSKIKKVKHQPALPYKRLGAFLAALCARTGFASLALEFAVRTAARSGEVRGATWGEFDLDNGTWTVPGERMKGGEDHRVPLVGRALEIVTELSKNKVGDHVFPADEDKPLSDMTLLAVIKRMNGVAKLKPGEEAPTPIWFDPKTGSAIVPHGFRSTFRDWAGETTNFPREVCEMALAHKQGDKTEQAYWRGDVYDKRIELMRAWDQYCNTIVDNVVQLRGAA
jgi:integrase